jgi:PAS domain S-box-containing protein
MDQLPDYGFLLENLMNNSSDSIYFKDLQSRFIMVNQTCADKHKWTTPEAIKGKTDFDTFSREHAEQAYADEQRIIKTGEALDSVEEKETWNDGSVTWVSTTKMPLKDERGKIIGTFGISRDITERKEAELRAKQYADQVREIKEEMEEEVRMAGRLQRNFCPSSYPVFPEAADPEDSCTEFLYSFNLSRQVTGDYCAIFKLSENEVGIFISDVRGTGIRASLGTALIRGIMQEISGHGRDPSAYLGRMNDLLLPLMKKEGLMLDVTACYLVLDVSTGKIKLVNAGHPMPILFRDSAAAEWLFDSSENVGPALAVESDPAYVTVERQIQPEDAVVLSTDGLYTVENSLGDPYGKKRLIDSAHSLAGESLKEIFEGLEGDALAFSRDGKFNDDVCLVGVHLKKLMEQE